MATAPTMRKRIMGSYLRRLREESGLTVTEAHEEMGIGRASFYRHERGESSVSLAEAEKYLRVYGVTSQSTIDRVISLARTSKASGWWNLEPGSNEGSVQAELAEMEDMAYELWTHEDQAVPALIQTSEYSESIIRLVVNGDFSEKRAQNLIAFRERRRSVMERDVHGRFHFRFHETAMHAWAGERQILTDQAAHLRNLIRAGHDIRMLPFSAGHSSNHAKTSVLVSADPNGDDEIAYVQGFPIGTILHDDDAITAIHAMFTTLEAHCLSPLDTAGWLTDTFTLD